MLVDPKAPAGSGGHGAYNWVIPSGLPVSATYFFDIGCEYAGIGASGATFKIESQQAVGNKARLLTPAQKTVVKPGERLQLDPQPEPPAPK